MKTSPSPLQIGSYYFTELKLETNPGAKESDLDKINVDVEVNPFLRSKENIREWCMILRVKITPIEGALAPYSGNFELFGLFSVSPTWSEKQIEQLVYVNGGGILYGAAREMTYQLSGRGFWKALTLPCISFFEMWKAKKAQEDSEAKATAEAEAASGPLAETSARPA
jgi:preprotein translocase subunit SecB